MHLPSARTASTATARMSRRRLAALLWGKQPSQPPSSSSSCAPSVGQSRSSSSWLAQRRRRPRKYTTDALEWTTGNSTANCGGTSSSSSSSQSAAASARVLPQHSYTSSNSMANAATTTSSHGSVYQMTDSAPSILFSNSRNTVVTPPPTTTQLQAQFWAAAIPMVGFGFMDNLVMIQAGSYIDMTLGVSLGLATMTAAAAGQVISDVSGVIFGNTMESVFAKWLPTNDTLTAAQRQLPVVGRVRLWGAVVGVTVGCALGALTLLLVDLEAKDKHAQWTQLQDILQDLQHYTTTTATGAAGQHHPQAHAHAQFTVHVITHPEEKEHSYFSQNNNHTNNNTTSMIQPLHLHHDNTPHNIQITPASSVMQACIQTQSTITREYVDDDYDGDERSSTNTTTTTVIHYVPIHAGNDVVGVLEYKQQQHEQQSLENHHDHDEITSQSTRNQQLSKDRAELLAGHIGILLNRM